MKKHKTIEFAIYNKEGDFIDILNLTNKEAKEFKKDNPEYSLEEIDSLEDDNE